jgi:hypothetical protein
VPWSAGRPGRRRRAPSGSRSGLSSGGSSAAARGRTSRRGLRRDARPASSPPGAATRAVGAARSQRRDATLERHCELLENKCGVVVSVATMCRTVGRLGWTFKKVVGGHRTGRTSQDLFQGTARRGRPRAAKVRRRVLDQHSAYPTLRKGAQRRKGPREGPPGTRARTSPSFPRSRFRGWEPL